VILNTVDYKQKITSLLEDPSYKRLVRDLTVSQKIYLNNYVRLAPDPQDCMDFRRYIKRGFL